jgi:membrane fusion protein (multidrug efflux system)
MLKKDLFWIVVLAGLFFTISCKKGEKKIVQAAIGRSALEVNALVVSLSSLDHAYSYTGTLLANEEIDLRPEISAKVTGILFKEGTQVRKGQHLVKMFDNDLQAQLKKNKLQIELAEKELVRKSELINFKGISKEEYEISENKLNTLKAEQDLLLAQISKTELNAPFSGVVGLRKVSEGSFVSNTTIITSIQQVDPIKVEFSVPEKFISSLTVGKDIEFTIEGLDDIFHANIYAMESKIDAATRSIRIRALCPNSELKLFPGSFASIKLNFTPMKECIIIPARSIFPVLNGEQVFVIRNGKAKPVSIKAGLRDGTKVEVLEGLAPNDTLVLSGLLQIKEGMPVKVKFENK